MSDAAETPKTAAQFKDLGNKCLAEKKIDEAIAAYTSAIELEPSNHVFYSNRSAAHMTLKNGEAALKDADACIERKPDWARGYSRRANALDLLERHADVMDTCREGLLLDPASVALAKNLTSACLNRMKGKWWGTASPEQGGYDQEIDFKGTDKTMGITVMGQSMNASFTLDVTTEPMQMMVSMPGPHSTVPHIFRFTNNNNNNGPCSGGQDGSSGEDGGLDLCGPHETLECPTKFQGPGLLSMRRGALPVLAADKALDTLDEHDKLVRFLAESIEAIPDTLVAMLPTDAPDVQAVKLRTSMEYQKETHNLHLRYGEGTVACAQRLVAGVDVPGIETTPCLAAAAAGLKNKMLEHGLVTTEALDEIRASLKGQPAEKKKETPEIEVVEAATATPTATPTAAAAAPAPAAAPAAAPVPATTANATTVDIDIAALAREAAAEVLQDIEPTKDEAEEEEESTGDDDKGREQLLLGLVAVGAAAAVVGGLVFLLRGRKGAE